MSRGKDTLWTRQSSFTTLIFNVCSVMHMCIHVHVCMESHMYMLMHVHMSTLRSEIAAGCLYVLLSSFTMVSFYQVTRVHSDKHLKTSS